MVVSPFFYGLNVCVSGRMKIRRLAVRPAKFLKLAFEI